MIVSLLAAVDEQLGIGINNRLPWHLSADLARFKKVTMGHHIVMGRKTYQSIGKPLPGRTSIVVTRNPEFHAPGCLTAGSVASALELARAAGETEVFVIGGYHVFVEALPLADRFYLTQVHAQVQADTYFPEFNMNEWEEAYVERFPQDDRNEYPATFRILNRIRKEPLEN
jgi:dihydrofolate reductase